jgi:sec-independent protein translocase protein TatC
MVTPDASPVTIGLMFAALILLYEISLLVARIALRKRSKAKEEQLAQEAKEAQEAREEMRQLKKDFDQHLWGSEEEQKKQAEELALQKAKREQAAANQASKSEVQ